MVEVAWVFVDRDGDPIYPAGQFSLGNRDSCDLPGRLGGDPVRYDLRFELEICDLACPGGCGDPQCLVMDPLVFPCNTARGSERDVPASDDPYLFTVRSVITVESRDLVCREPLPTCVAVPGPRARSVRSGLVTDLQVYQVVIDVDQDHDDVLDLEACGCA